MVGLIAPEPPGPVPTSDWEGSLDDQGASGSQTQKESVNASKECSHHASRDAAGSRGAGKAHVPEALLVKGA